MTGAGPMYWFSGDNNWSVRVVNDCIQRGIPSGMVVRKIAAPYDTIPLGTFVVDATSRWAKKYVTWAAANYGVDFTSIDGLKMEQLASFRSSVDGNGSITVPKVMVNVDAQTIWALKNMLGFKSVTSGSTPQRPDRHRHVRQLVRQYHSGQRDDVDGRRQRASVRTYIGIGRSGSGYGATNTLETLIPTCTVAGDPDPTFGDNGMCAVDFAADDIVTAGYPAKDFVFAYPPVWYSVTDPPSRSTRPMRTAARAPAPISPASGTIRPT